MDELKPCPFVLSGECDVPPCNGCMLDCKCKEGRA